MHHIVTSFSKQIIWNHYKSYYFIFLWFKTSNIFKLYFTKPVFTVMTIRSAGTYKKPTFLRHRNKGLLQLLHVFLNRLIQHCRRAQPPMLKRSLCQTCLSYTILKQVKTYVTIVFCILLNWRSSSRWGKQFSLVLIIKKLIWNVEEFDNSRYVTAWNQKSNQIAATLHLHFLTELAQNNVNFLEIFRHKYIFSVQPFQLCSLWNIPW